MENPKFKLVLKPGQEVYFTSDTHYGHHNIVEAISNWEGSRNKRPFKSIAHMNTVIVDKINATVGEDDILFHLGDWSFGSINAAIEFRDRIKCKNIYLITGNHDEKIEENRKIPEEYFDDKYNLESDDTEFNRYDKFINDPRTHLQDLFTMVTKYMELTIIYPQLNKATKQRRVAFNLFHYPIHSFNFMNKGRKHLFGHVHLPKHLRSINQGMDVGVEGNNYYPYSVDEILDILDGNGQGRITLLDDHHD